jgi:anti-sigma B factor antagonist
MADTVLPLSARTAGTDRSPLATTLRVEGTRTAVVLRGEADVSTTAVLSDALSRVIALPDGDVVIDLAGLDFIDTSTVQVLAVGERLLHRRGRRLSFRSPSPLATTVLESFALGDRIEARDGARP